MQTTMIGTTIHDEVVEVAPFRGRFRILIDGRDWHGPATSEEQAVQAAATLVPEHRRSPAASGIPAFGGAR